MAELIAGIEILPSCDSAILQFTPIGNWALPW
jgi:hypothetical protein